MRVAGTRLIKYGLFCLAVGGTLAGCVTRSEPSGGSPPPPEPAPVVAPEPQPSPEPAAPAPVPVTEKVSFGAELGFAAGSAALGPAARATLAKMLENLGGSSVEVFVVAGHTDNTLAAGAARRLSMRRADAVKDYLVSRGIDQSRIYTEAKSSAKPIASNKSAAGRAQNNRATIEVLATRSYRTDTSAWMPNNVIPVLYATNRKRTGSDNPFYFYGNKVADGAEAATLERGVAVVRVPRERERGEIERPTWAKVVIKRAADSIGVENLPQLVLPNPDTDFLFEHKLQVMTGQDFKKTLKNAVAASKSKTAILYIHGYNNDFTDAAFRTAQIVYDLAEADYDVVPLMFSWPSNPGLVGWNYPTAGRRTQESGYALAQYLREIAQTTDIGTVHIVAHSLGSQVLGNALMKLGAAAELSATKGGKSVPVFRHIVFAAADISPKIFTEVVAPAIKARHTVTSYISSNDKVLRASEFRNGEGRVGFSFDNLPKCVDTIDVTPASRGLAHSTWADSPWVISDLRNLLRYSIAPSKRGLRSRPGPNREYWAFASKAPVNAQSFAPAVYSTLLPCDPAPR